MENISRRDFVKTAVLGIAGVVVAPFVPKVELPEPENQEPVGRDPAIWHTQDGRSIPIKDMTNEHLLNTINFLYARTANVAEASGTRRVYPRILYNMLKEADRRKLLGMPRATVMRFKTTIQQ